MKYARDVVRDVVRYRLHKMGFGSGTLAFAESEYAVKVQEDSSHLRILSWLSDRSPKKVLDLGCSDGRARGSASKARSSRDRPRRQRGRGGGRIA